MSEVDNLTPFDRSAAIELPAQRIERPGTSTKINRNGDPGIRG